MQQEAVKLASIVSDRVTAHDSLTWCPTSIIVPNTVPTMTNCEIIIIWISLHLYHGL